VQNFETSPDGDQLAFYGDGSIYVVELDGALPRKVCSASPYAAPSWAPDGQSLVFSEDRALRVVDVSTGDVRRITTGEHPIYTPDLSPDGRTVLFTMQHKNAFALWTVPARGGDPAVLLDGAAFGTYSPDARSIAFRRTNFGDGDFTEMSDASVWVAGSDGERPHRISPETAWMSQISSSALWPAWSPDGTRIAYQPRMDRPLRIIEVSTGRTHTVATGTQVDWLDDDTLIVGDATLMPG
jgi:Tol biopolymer transport system component